MLLQQLGKHQQLLAIGPMRLVLFPPTIPIEGPTVRACPLQGGFHETKHPASRLLQDSSNPIVLGALELAMVKKTSDKPTLVV